MNIKEKRIELSEWISNVDEEMLSKVDELKKSLSNEIVIYKSNGKGLTKEEYKDYLEGISKKVETGSKVYTSKEVRNFILNRK